MNASRKDLLISLQGRICPACGKPKHAKQTFCSTDYYRLPKAQRDALFRRVGAGYEEAVSAAMRYLGAATFRMPDEVPATKEPSLFGDRSNEGIGR